MSHEGLFCFYFPACVGENKTPANTNITQQRKEFLSCQQKKGKKLPLIYFHKVFSSCLLLCMCFVHEIIRLAAVDYTSTVRSLSEVELSLIHIFGNQIRNHFRSDDELESANRNNFSIVVCNSDNSVCIINVNTLSSL